MASASTSAVVHSDSEGNDFIDAETDEERAEEDEEWINTPYFHVEHVMDEFKSHARRAMKEPMIEDPVYKKLSYSILNSIKLNKMMYISLRTSVKSVHSTPLLQLYLPCNNWY